MSTLCRSPIGIESNSLSVCGSSSNSVWNFAPAPGISAAVCAGAEGFVAGSGVLPVNPSGCIAKTPNPMSAIKIAPCTQRLMIFFRRDTTTPTSGAGGVSEPPSPAGLVRAALVLRFELRPDRGNASP